MRVFLILFILASIAAAGILLSVRLSERANHSIRNEMLVQAVEIAECVDYRDVLRLSFDSSDYFNPTYIQICNQFGSFSRLAAYRGIYTMKLNNDSIIVFGPESFPPNHPMASSPGKKYLNPDKLDFEVFTTGNPLVFGPITDEYGTFICALAPVTNPLTGEVVLVVGVDIEDELLNHALLYSRVLPLLFAFLLIVLVLFIHHADRRHRKLKPDERYSRRWQLSTLFFLVGLTLTLSVTIMISFIEKRQQKDVMLRHSMIYSQKLNDKLKEIKQYLNSTAVFFQSSQEVDSAEFANYSQHIFDNKEFIRLLWCAQVTESENQDEIPVRNYQNRLEYAYSVHYQQPYDSTLNLLGKEVSDISVYAKAMAMAAETRRAVALPSNRKSSALDTSDEIVIVVPVYGKTPSPEDSETLDGFIIAYISAQRLINQAIRFPEGTNSLFSTAMYELSQGDPPLLFATYPEEADETEPYDVLDNSQQRYSWQRVAPAFEFGRAYAVFIHSGRNRLIEPSSNYALLSLISGLFLTFLLTGFFMQARTRQTDLDSKVEKRTAMLNERIRQMKSLQQISEVMNHRTPAENLCNYVLKSVVAAMRSSDQACAMIVIDKLRFKTDNYQEIDNRIFADITPFKELHGKISLGYLTGEHFSSSEAIFLKQVAELFSNYLEREMALNDLMREKEKAEMGIKLKNAFINNISHEIRTPLSGILGLIPFLIDEKTSSNEKTEYLSLINHSGYRLLNTITDYMDISLLASGALEIVRKQFDLYALMMEMHKKFQPDCENKGLYCLLHLPRSNSKAIVHSDSELIQKILGQLINNAIKFTPTGGIEFGFVVNESTVELFVSDTGVGIAEEAKEMVFLYFSQEDSGLSRVYEGSGLGLPITKGIVELLEGTIELDSSKGIGTKVSVRLPLRTEQVKPEPVSPSLPEKADILDYQTPSVKKLILIAEDDDSNFYLMSVLLEKASYRFVRAINGRQAIELCSTMDDIGLVLMDIKMPELNGFEATRRIKEMRPELPVIAITAYAMSGDQNLALESGCDEYLAKPFKIDEFLSLLSKFN